MGEYMDRMWKYNTVLHGRIRKMSDSVSDLLSYRGLDPRSVERNIEEFEEWICGDCFYCVRYGVSVEDSVFAWEKIADKKGPAYMLSLSSSAWSHIIYPKENNHAR